GAQRAEGNRARVPFAATPPGMTLVELGPRRTDEEDRHAARPVDEMLEELDQRRVGPVQILEHEDQRTLFSDPLEESQPRCIRLFLVGATRVACPDARRVVRRE